MAKIGRSFKGYGQSPEMRLFWLFLVLVLGTATLNLFYLPAVWQIVSLMIFIAAGALIFFNSWKTARSNQALKIEHNRLNSVINNLNDGVIAYDEQFNVLVLNPAAEQIFNLKASEVVGKTFSLDSAKDTRFRLLTQVMFPSLAPTVIKRSDHGIFPQIVDIILENPHLELKVSTAKILDDSGGILGYIKLIKDRTRELELLHAKSEFITVASHQLRTPLTAVVWSLESLKKESLNESQKELVITGGQAANKLLETVDGLLNVAKIEEGKFGYQFEQINLAEFLEKLLQQSLVIAQEYKVNVYFDKPKEEISLMADSQKLGVVVATLIDNAIKYNVPNGQVVVKLERLVDQPFVQVSVKDTGVGIPPEEIDKLFTKFFRAKNVLQFKTEGSGLGLYIAKNIVKRHGGEIWAESVLNRGSTFYFTLPTDSTLIPPKEIVYGEE